LCIGPTAVYTNFCAGTVVNVVVVVRLLLLLAFAAAILTLVVFDSMSLKPGVNCLSVLMSKGAKKDMLSISIDWNIWW
jgi:hypothetical protein